ncbi:Uncharacterized protein APZ42_004351 [Daphnia magna]|uniref:Uncharacterized protein n=1 Tax=Daphnia magna TaxID=35525 RepID=A0A164H458_9CRUS|nr:Uncharacterized protein APZ42_004351 [Daphnia magna]
MAMASGNPSHSSSDSNSIPESLSKGGRVRSRPLSDRAKRLRVQRVLEAQYVLHDERGEDYRVIVSDNGLHNDAPFDSSGNGAPNRNMEELEINVGPGYNSESS